MAKRLRNETPWEINKRQSQEIDREYMLQDIPSTFQGKYAVLDHTDHEVYECCLSCLEKRLGYFPTIHYTMNG